MFHLLSFHPNVVFTVVTEWQLLRFIHMSIVDDTIKCLCPTLHNLLLGYSFVFKNIRKVLLSLQVKASDGNVLHLKCDKRYLHVFMFPLGNVILVKLEGHQIKIKLDIQKLWSEE